MQSVKAGRTAPAAALRIIRTARERADKVRDLLRVLRDAAEQLPLSARFRRTGKRLQQLDLDDATADSYAQLTLAVHDLNLLLGDAFYPGSASQKPKSRAWQAVAAPVGVALLLWAAGGWLRADQVQMQNGDRYAGQVLSLNTNIVVLQSEVLGTLRLPRAKVAAITVGTNAGPPSPPSAWLTNAQVRAPSAAPVSASNRPPPALGQLGASTNLIQQVQKQFLGGAGPEANDKFNELLGGLMTGKLSVDDIRVQAQSAADQLRALKREGGEQAGFAADAYLAILDHFLNESAPAVSASNGPGSIQKAKPRSDQAP